MKLLISQTIDDIIEYAEFITLPLKHRIISWIRDYEPKNLRFRSAEQEYSPDFFFWPFVVTGMGLRRNKSKLSSTRSKFR